MGQDLEAIKMAIRDEFLGHFRAMQAQPGDVLPVQWLHDDFLTSLNDKENRALEEVVSEMIREGLIEYVGGPKPTYAVTRKGLAILCQPFSPPGAQLA